MTMICLSVRNKISQYHLTSELANTYREIYSKYDIKYCRYAIRDIDDTLKLWINEPENDYVKRLYLQRDLLLDRIREINRMK